MGELIDKCRSIFAKRYTLDEIALRMAMREGSSYHEILADLERVMDGEPYEQD